jgi:hypothetical protein
LNVSQDTRRADQVELVGGNLFGTELLGRAVEVRGEADHGTEVDADRFGREVAELKILEESLPKWCHGSASGGVSRRGGDPKEA